MRTIIFVSLVAVFMLMPGCNFNNSSGANSVSVANSEISSKSVGGVSSKDGASSAVKPNASVTVPAGWEEVKGVAIAQYSKGTASVILTCDIVPSDIKNADDYVEFAKKKLSKAFADASFSEAKKITIGGNEARELDFTTTVMGMTMKYRIVYILKGSSAYTLTCAAVGEDVNTLASELQSIIDSFKIV